MDFECKLQTNKITFRFQMQNPVWKRRCIMNKNRKFNIYWIHWLKRIKKKNKKQQQQQQKKKQSSLNRVRDRKLLSIFYFRLLYSIERILKILKVITILCLRLRLDTKSNEMKENEVEKRGKKTYRWQVKGMSILWLQIQLCILCLLPSFLFNLIFFFCSGPPMVGTKFWRLHSAPNSFTRTILPNGQFQCRNYGEL